MIIRQERPDDYLEVYELVKQAFATTSHSDGTEQDYLNEVRKKKSFIPELSFVAVEADTIVGQIVLYTMQITCDDWMERQLVISPLSVLPSHFCRGIGSKLIETGCRKAKELGFKAAFLCGDPAYYSKLGFVPTHQFGIYHVKDTDRNAEWCMVKELEQGFLSGMCGTIDIE